MHPSIARPHQSKIWRWIDLWRRMWEWLIKSLVKNSANSYIQNFKICFICCVRAAIVFLCFSFTYYADRAHINKLYVQFKLTFSYLTEVWHQHKQSGNVIWLNYWKKLYLGYKQHICICINTTFLLQPKIIECASFILIITYYKSFILLSCHRFVAKCLELKENLSIKPNLKGSWLFGLWVSLDKHKLIVNGG